MSLDSDVVLLGTGVAPLVAANLLIAQGKSVLVLNPDWDFFLENSELPLDPLVQGKLTPQRMIQSSPENALAQLRPDFPGPIEFWSAHTDREGYHDPLAPHVRQRGRLWISSLENHSSRTWEELEDFYVEASDAGLNPQILDGLTAIRKFPSFSPKMSHHRGLFIPKLCDVDTVRYRNGLLEFVRERLDPDHVICAVNQLELMPEGIRFHSKGTLKTAKIRQAMLAFWTPRLSPWILNQAKNAEITPCLPVGVRLWEQWYLNSKVQHDPNTVGMFGNMIVWSDFEGLPSYFEASNRSLLSVLRAGPLVGLDQHNLPKGGLSWASAESFDSLSDLCHGFLKWDKFTIRSLKARAIFEWNHEKRWLISGANPRIEVIPGCDGPLVDVVRVARSACHALLMED